MEGRRLADQPIGGMPRGPRGGKLKLKPGDYWKVLTRHEPRRPLNVRDHLEDRGYWGNVSDSTWAGNLTGGVWGVIDPNGNHGMLSIHTVREEDDGTISVRPSDGSSNSILISSPTPDGEPQWHGYIEHGVWSEC